MDLAGKTTEELCARIRELEQQLVSNEATKTGVVRPKIAQMSSEVVDSNPYR